MEKVYKKSITCPTQDGTLSGNSVPPIAGHSVKWHGRTPANILLDQEMSDLATRIFGILSLKTFQGNIATLGVRKLETLTGRGRSIVHRALQELAKAGHIAPASKTRGQRAQYVLTSPVFGQKQRDLNSGKSSTEDLVSHPRKHLATARLA